MISIRKKTDKVKRSNLNFYIGAFVVAIVKYY